MTAVCREALSGDIRWHALFVGAQRFRGPEHPHCTVHNWVLRVHRHSKTRRDAPVGQLSHTSTNVVLSECWWRWHHRPSLSVIGWLEHTLRGVVRFVLEQQRSALVWSKCDAWLSRYHFWNAEWKLFADLWTAGRSQLPSTFVSISEESAV